MTPQEIADGLERIATSEHFVHESYQLVEQWEAAGVGEEAVEPILRFIERDLDIDLGTPGPLVHFVEQFDGYDQKLFASLARKPTSHTVWMLHRIINVTHARARRERLVGLLEAACNHSEADELTKEQAKEFLEGL
jgi:hypothetical protein